MELLVMALILAAVLFGQYFVYSRFGLKNLSYTLTICTEEAYEGDEIEIIEEIDNAKALPLPWIRTEISCPRWLSFHGTQSGGDGKDEQRGLVSSVFVLRGYQKIKRSWRVRCEKRGVFEIEDVSLSVGDLFGLAKPAVVFKIGDRVRVLPTPADMENGEMSGETFIGDMTVKRFVLPDPFIISGAKEYTGREPMNRIHWAQTARTGELMAYNNEFSTERRVLILMNMQRGYHSSVTGLSASALEASIKGAAFILDVCFKSRAEAALYANCSPVLMTECAAGYEHTIELLRRLSELESGCGEHIDDFAERLDFTPYTDVIFISSFLSEKTADILRGLCASGKRCSIFTTSIESADFCEVRYIPQMKKYF